MLFTATHITRHRYETPVSQSHSEARLTPRVLPGQQVHRTSIRVQPEPANLLRRTDYFGNEVTSFEIFEQHDCLTAEAISVIELQPQTAGTTSTVAWEVARDLLATPSDSQQLEACEFVFDSPFVSAHPELAEFARSSFTPGRPLGEAALELSHRVHSDFHYQPQSTSIDMPLLDVFRNRSGVCQDFAHIMIGALRSLHLAARYVSGYLRSREQYRGGEASHAWVAVFVPGSGWLSFDPTNDVVPSDGHFTLAWGRDYGDVAPMKGITMGGGRQTIEVEVRVQPLANPG